MPALYMASARLPCLADTTLALSWICCCYVVQLRRGAVAGDGKVTPGNTYSLYDSNGNRVLVQEQNQLDTSKIATRQMVYAADGTLLKKNDGTASSLSTMVNNKVQYASITAGGVAHHFSSNGNYLGEIAKDKAGRISSSLKDQHFTGPTQSDSSNVIQYQVQSGDSLKSLALNFYGNADYWYLIANLNGLTSSPDEALSAGLSIDIPARASSTNSANSFKPMDLQKIIGDTTPSLPYVPPAPAAGCNAVAMIVMIAITVVATIATAGALGPAAGTLMQSGMTALAGGLGWAGAAAAAAGGFVGSVAGQLAGKAMGVVDSFSLKNAFASGLTAGATAGLGNLMGVGSTASTTVNGAKAATSPFVTFADGATKATLNLAGKMTMAASAAGISVGANKLAGNNKASFQWRNVVTAAVSAGAMHGLGITDTQSSWSKGLSDIGFGADVLNGFAGAAVGYGVSKGLYNEGSWNFRNVATDVFGNALGNSIVSGLSTKPGELSKQTQRELAQAEKSNVVSPELARKVMQETGQSLGGLSVGLDGNKLLVGDGSTNWRGDLSQMDNYRDLSMARNSLISEFGSNMDTDAGRMLNLSFMQLQGKKARELAETPIAQSAAYLQGMARGEARYNHINRDRIAQQQRFAQTSRQLNAMNQAQYNYELANPMGGWGDVVWGMGQGFVDSVYQGVQFLGTSVAALTPLGQGISYATGNGPLNPFDVQYHSLLDAPTNRMQAAGRFMGEFTSIFAGGEGLLLAGAKGASKLSSLTELPLSRGEILRQKYGYLSREQRLQRIDELSNQLVQKQLLSDLGGQDHVYRAVMADDLRYYDNGISRAFGQPAYFSLDGGDSLIEHMSGAQMKDKPDLLLRIPVSEIRNPSVARPYGYTPESMRPTKFGWEYNVNSYPQYGSGGYRQFLGTTERFDPSWIYKDWRN